MKNCCVTQVKKCLYDWVKIMAKIGENLYRVVTEAATKRCKNDMYEGRLKNHDKKSIKKLRGTNDNLWHK